MAPVTSPIPPTLLTLRLSSPSFLETILTDNGCPVYSTETFGNTTSLSRSDRYTGLRLIANIGWPESSSPKGKAKETPQAQLFIDGSTMYEDELLKRNRLNTSRKFRIPGHSHSLKWRRVQGVFQCTSSAGVPVAVFEPAIITARARLNVFVPTLSGLPEPQGDPVAPILLDYLLVTAILLLTHPEDWHGFRHAALPASVPALAPGCAPASMPMCMRTALPHIAIPPTRTPRPPTASSTTSTASSATSTSASSLTPVSPIMSAMSEMSSAVSEASPCWDERERVRGRMSADAHLARPKEEEVVEIDPPPPYEEIQWTVRVRQPRRVRA